MRKITTLFFSVCFIFLLSLASFAAAPRLVDEANLLDASAQKRVTAVLDQVSDKYGMNIAVVTMKSAGDKKVGKLANEILDKRYRGAKGGAMVLLIVMSTRDWYISTDNTARQAITDAFGIDKMEENIVSELSKGKYEKAFTEYAGTADTLMSFYQKNGRAMAWNDEVWWLPLVIALGGAGLLTFGLRKWLVGSMCNVKEQVSADAYIKDGSFNLTDSDDIYLYTDVHVKTIQKKGGGGGRYSAADSEHGGGGGKF